MTTQKSLPARPSLESLRKQARKLARGTAAGNPDALARVRAQLPDARFPLSRRDAQLVLSREYGFAGWRDLTAEVLKRVGEGLDWAAGQAKAFIHDNNVEGLRRLLEEYPDLLAWRGEPEGLLGAAVNSYADSFEPDRERNYTRRECAELLIDAGAVVEPSICEGLLASRTRGMLQLFQSKGLLPGTLNFLVALGDAQGVRAYFDEGGHRQSGATGELAITGDGFSSVFDAFMHACRFQHEAIALFLLDRCIALDAGLGRKIDGGPGRAALVNYLREEQSLAFMDVAPADPWQAFVMYRVVRSLQDNDIATFVDLLQSESWLLGESCIGLHVGMIQRAVLRDRGELIGKLLDLSPALLRSQPTPPSQAIEFAFTYAKAHLIPLLTRVWPLPDDLPHAAGIGDLASVKRWLEGDSAERLRRASSNVQQVLDQALAWAVLNHHYDVATHLNG